MKYMLIMLCITSVLSVFYFLGAARQGFSVESLGYAKYILTTFVFSSSIFWLSIRRPKKRRLDLWRISVMFQRIALAVLFVWTIWSIEMISAMDIVDNRDVVGYSYLTVSDILAMLSLVMLARKGIRAYEFAIILSVTFYILAFLGSRASIVVFFVAAMLAASVRGGGIKYYTSMVVILVLGCALAFYYLVENLDVFSRLNTLLNLGTDESLLTRLEFVNTFIYRLSDDVTCLLIPCQPEPGRYFHGLLSLIEYFGVAGLLVILSMFGFFAVRPRMFLSQWYSGLFIYALISSLMFRAWVSPVYAAVFAIMMILFASVLTNISSRE